jgi:hypothetical protein
MVFLRSYLSRERDSKTVDAIDCPTVWRGIVDTLREKLLSVNPSIFDLN